MRATPRSFRGLTSRERGSIVRLTLGVGTARRGENLGTFSKRVRSAWTVEELAVTNALSADTGFRGGELLKYAATSPYRGRRQ